MVWITLIVVAALFVLFWGLSAFLQAYLYNESAANIPARAAVAALLVGGVLCVWVYANKTADRKGKYGPLHEFDSTSKTDIHEFTAVRKYTVLKGPDGQPKEEKVIFRRKAGQKSAPFLADKTAEPFKLNSGDFLTIALVVNEPGGKTARFEPVIDTSNPKVVSYQNDKQFFEKDTKRYMDGDPPGTVTTPSTKTMVFAILLNVMTLVAWFVGFWLVMRFAFAHAMGLAVVFGILTILVVAPLLFEQVRPKETTNKLEPVVGPSGVIAPVDPGLPNEGEKK